MEYSFVFDYDNYYQYIGSVSVRMYMQCYFHIFHGNNCCLDRSYGLLCCNELHLNNFISGWYLIGRHWIGLD